MWKRIKRELILNNALGRDEKRRKLKIDRYRNNILARIHELNGKKFLSKKQASDTKLKNEDHYR